MKGMKTFLSLIFKTALLTVTIYGLFLVFNVPTNGLEVLAYFTTMANIFTGIVLVFSILSMVVYKKESQAVLYFKQAVLVFLILTTLVYSFLLIPYILNNDINYEIWSLKDVVIHYIVPVGVMMDYGLFSQKGKIKKFYALTNPLFLAGYLMFLFGYISLGGRFTASGNTSLFPYFFLNYNLLGFPLVLTICLLVLLTVILISWLFQLIDHIIGIPLLINSKRK
jgi:hypothetical protein